MNESGAKAKLGTAEIVDILKPLVAAIEPPARRPQ